MSALLRKIRRGRWLNDRPRWLPDSEIPADTLGDLNTSENGLSVYMVYDENNMEILRRIAAALIVTGTSPSNLDYMLIESEIVLGLGMKLKTAQGETPDNYVNSLHAEVSEVSAERLVRLAGVMFPQAEKRGRVTQKTIEEQIVQAVQSEWFDMSSKSIQENMRHHIQRLLGRRTS